MIIPIEMVREELGAKEFEDAKRIIGLRKLLACLDREEDTTLSQQARRVE